MYVLYDGAREKSRSVNTLFFVCSLWWSKRKDSFCYNIIFCVLFMIKQEKKFIVLPYYFLYVVYDGGTEKTHFVITLFFVSCLWWSKKKNWFCYQIISCIFSMMEQEKKLIFDNIIFFVLSIMQKGKNSFCYNVTFRLLCMMKQEKKFIVL